MGDILPAINGDNGKRAIADFVEDWGDFEKWSLANLRWVWVRVDKIILWRERTVNVPGSEEFQGGFLVIDIDRREKMARSF